MKPEQYKIFMVDEYSGREEHYMTMFDKVEAEKTILLLDAQKWPGTGWCYYDNEGLRYDVSDAKNDLPEISFGNPNKIEVDLGYAKLVAEKNSDPSFKEVFVGLNDKNGDFLQDLAVVGGAYHIDGMDVVQDKGVSVKVYSDKDNEDYTHEFSVDIYEPEQEKSVDELIDSATERCVDGCCEEPGKDEFELN